MANADEVRRSAQACAEFLERAEHTKWDVAIPEMEMTVGEVVAHAADGCLWYAIDLAASGKDLPLTQHNVTTNGSNTDLVDTLRTYAAVVAAVVETSPSTARGFHPLGSADPSGFAAMACDEMLIHTDDAARGLGLVFDPPNELAASVLTRLFPWVRPGEDAWNQLKWANGRIAFGDLPRLEDWAWHCAPLAEWDGNVPTRPTR